MNRRFFIFNNQEAVLKHISEIKTLSDLLQLERDIKASETNLTRFQRGTTGIFAVDCCAGATTYRHIFFTVSAYKRFVERFGELQPGECNSHSILES